MEIFFIKLLQLVLALSILILLHEGGHFVFAKLFGVRVEKFYMFFDWKFSLFKYKPKNSDTEYGIGWLPLGGYCKISGMIDESFDTEQMKRPAQPWEFRTKPAWQRLLIMVGGVLVNFVLALFIYSMILFYWGESYVPVKDMTMGMKFNQEAKAYGFQDGDILVGTDKRAFKNFSADMYRDISEAHRVDIIRDGKAMSIQLPGDLNLLNMIKSQPSFVQPLLSNQIDSVLPGSTAYKIGMKKGDYVYGIDGKAVSSYNEFIDMMARHTDMLTTAKNREDSIKARTATIVFGNEKMRYTAKVVLHSNLKLGITYRASQYKPVTTRYGFFESFPAGIRYGWNVLTSYIDDLKYVFTAEGAKSLGGFGTIGNLFPAEWNWLVFWQMTAFLSIILAFMNILPIPALDGGHVLFLLYEIITRRKPSEEFMIRAEYVGFGIVLLLLIVANLNDILRQLGIL
jgi:regulator of sigma E protease